MISRFFWSAVVCVSLSISAHAGLIEICKDSFPAGSLSGTFSFTVAGQSGTFVAPVGACTAAFSLPDGPAFITELPQIDATLFSIDTFPADRLLSFDLGAGTATVQIVAGDISHETVLTFTNAPAGAMVIPEPGTAWLLGLGGLAFCAVRRRRRTHLN